MIHAFFDLFSAHASAQTVLIISLVIALGHFLGNIRFFGIQFGIAGVLFAGILLSSTGVHLHTEILQFLRELGLIFFVYTVGIQLGPSFMNSFKKDGMRLNLIAACIASGGFVIALVLGKITGLERSLMAGLLSGATTNTPSLAAAQETLRSLGDAASIDLSGVGYAVAYPAGILGAILSLLFVKWVFRVDVATETIQQEARTQKTEKLHVMNFEVTNPNLDGLTIRELPYLDDSPVVISRIMHQNHVAIARPETRIQLGDILVAVGHPSRLEDLQRLVGRVSVVDLRTLSKDIVTRRIVVTKKEVLGKAIPELGLYEKYDVVFTRIIRAEVEIPVTAGTTLSFGDVLFAVGNEEGLKQAAKELGNVPSQLNDPQLIPVFLGIFLGVLLGMTPIPLPGLAVPVKLGLAGGPLIAALVLSRLGRLGPLVWYMPTSANFMLRELGISLFLGCVGLMSGSIFVDAVVNGQGLYWIGLGTLITLLPILTAGLFCRLVLHMNYLTICGLLAGSMTNPPSLAFAGKTTSSKAPGISYASVYPLAMLLRILFAQLLVIFLRK